eukprot:6382134-Amphidinium_carterae.1
MHQAASYFLDLLHGYRKVASWQYTLATDIAPHGSQSSTKQFSLASPTKIYAGRRSRALQRSNLERS